MAAADESFANRALQIYMGHRRAIEDNDPLDSEVSLEIAQALVIWWLSSNRPAVWKSNKVKQGFVKLHMPGIHYCLMKRHPTLDPDT